MKHKPNSGAGNEQDELERIQPWEERWFGWLRILISAGFVGSVLTAVYYTVTAWITPLQSSVPLFAVFETILWLLIIFLDIYCLRELWYDVYTKIREKRRQAELKLRIAEQSEETPEPAK